MTEKNITHAGTAWVRSAAIAAVLTVVGALLVVYRRDALTVILVAMGAIAVFIGALYVYDYVRTRDGTRLFIGVSAAVIGAVFILVPGLVSDVLMAMLAAGLIIFGALSFIRFAVSDAKTDVNGAITVFAGVVMMVLGGYALFNLDSTADLVMVVIGTFIILVGAAEAVKSYQTYRLYH